MASAAAMSAARSMPTVYTVPLGPRVRPPRLLPGTKAENTNPQPEGPVPPNQFWVQGKWRDPNSRASKTRRALQSTQVEKALRQSTHGMNIYAYRQIRTNQVVYSLSRVMQNNKILDQLIYHGKQTTPSALRRDVWRPYFSIHFPQTPAGAQAGLDTYQMLREFSARRQLSPSEGFLLATKEDVEKAQVKFDPATLARMKEEKSSDLSKLPRIGQLLPPKYRAQKLMDQKASSVADVAFALSLINDASQSPDEKNLRAAAQLKARHKDRSRRNRRRINEIRRLQETKSLQIEERQELIEPKSGQLGLDSRAAARIAIEHNGVLTTKDRVASLESIAQAAAASHISSPKYDVGQKPEAFDPNEFKEEFTKQWEAQHQDSVAKPPFPKEELETLIQEKSSKRQEEIEQWQQRAQRLDRASDPDQADSRRVLVLWSDLKDAMNAQKWSANVQHDWLDPKSVLKQQKSVVRQVAFADEEGHEIDEQRQAKLFQVSSSPHIIGRDVGDNWLDGIVSPAKEEEEGSNERIVVRRERIVREMVEAKSELRRITQLSRGSDAQQDELPDSNSIPIGQGNGAVNKKAFIRLSEKVDDLRSAYPEYDRIIDQLDYFAELITRQRELSRLVQELQPGTDGREDLMDQEHTLAKEIRDNCDTQFPGFSAFERKQQDALQEAHTETRIQELDAESTMNSVNLILAHHRRLLKDAGDESHVHAARDSNESTGRDITSSNGGRKFDQKALKGLQVEVDMQELDKRSMWSRIKGVFGG